MGALDGKVAVVCGGSRGLGRGSAVELGLAGAHVVVSGRTLNDDTGSGRGSLNEAVAEIEAAGGSASAHQCDFMDPAAVAALFEKVGADHGRVDVLVNSVFNSADFGPTIGKRFWELPLSFWEDVVDLGTKSAYLASVAAGPLLLEAGAGRGAERYRYNVAYGVGKAALDKMTRDMAEELRPYDIAVMSLWPNVTRTENLSASAAANPDAAAQYGDLDLLETPRYTGRAVVALATDPDRMARTGGRYWSAELAAAYGFTDENGREHPLPT
jgi:NAD(P)-dependent dehydrogenase (short-subunit alcohol dehydrogenase family)